jgi:uncharacterized protein (DUF736 family)
MTLWFKPMKYITIASAWINTDKNGKKYLSVLLEQDMKTGDKLYLRKNEFKKEGDKTPDYRYQVKSEVEPASDEEVITAEQVAEDVPF